VTINFKGHQHRSPAVGLRKSSPAAARNTLTDLISQLVYKTVTVRHM